MRRAINSFTILIVTPLLTFACAGSDSDDTYVGYVEAEYVYVAAPQAGWMEKLSVREGDEVTLGDVLFDLDKDQQRAALEEAESRAKQAAAQARDIATGARSEEIAALEAQLEEAKARFRLAKAERDRWTPLVAEGNASRAKGDQVVADYNAARARVLAAEEAIAVANLGGRDAAQDAAEAAQSAAEAALSQAAWNLGQRTVKAKTAGRVEIIFHRAGEFVPAGSPALAILPLTGLKVRFFVPQAQLPKFSVGETVRVSADGAASPVSATISFIAAEAEFTPPIIYSAGSREKLVFLVEARLPGDVALRPGEPVDVSAP